LILFQFFLYLDPFHRYSRPKTKVVGNCAEFCTFLPYQIFVVRAVKNLYQHFYPCLTANHTDKFGEVISTGPKVINQNTLHFEPIYGVLYLSKPWPFYTTRNTL